MMNVTEINFLKNFLLEQKGSILNKTQEFKSTQLGASEHLADDAEVASRDLSMSVSIHLHEKDRLMLLQIERALGKIENRTYGLCECCNSTIEFKRLQAQPFAVLCIECMEDQENPRNYLN